MEYSIRHGIDLSHWTFFTHLPKIHKTDITMARDVLEKAVDICDALSESTVSRDIGDVFNDELRDKGISANFAISFGEDGDGSSSNYRKKNHPLDLMVYLTFLHDESGEAASVCLNLEDIISDDVSYVARPTDGLIHDADARQRYVQLAQELARMSQYILDRIAKRDKEKS